MMSRSGWFVVALVVAMTGSAVVRAQPWPQPASDQDRRAEGRALYMTHCASCHGTSARGDGPAAGSMRVAPADLTQFAKRNGGLFPSARTYQIIEGRDVGAHGSVEMPVWGNVFRVTPPDSTEASVRYRIHALVLYLESIQERSGHEDPARRR